MGTQACCSLVGMGMPLAGPIFYLWALVSLLIPRPGFEGCGHPPFFPSRPRLLRPGSGTSWALVLQNSVLRLSTPSPPCQLFVPIQDAPGQPLAPDCFLWSQLGNIREKVPDPG